MDVRVDRVRPLAVDILGLELVPARGLPLPAFEPGSHIDLALPNGTVRQYSLCNGPLDLDRFHIAVLQDPCSRGGSACVHADLVQGSSLRIGGPRNLFPLHRGMAPALLFAGGIGVTPIRSMAEHLHAAGREFSLVYACRSKGRAAFAEEFARGAYASRCSFHFGGDARSTLDVANRLAAADPASHLYVCGPEGFISFVRAAAQAAGWPAERIHQERFAAAPAASTGEKRFTVKLARCGRTFEIPGDRTVSQVLQAAGVDLLTSCEQGICGTCIVPLLSGTPDHRDFVLSDVEKRSGRLFAPCCSRAASEQLVLDL